MDDQLTDWDWSAQGNSFYSSMLLYFFLQKYIGNKLGFDSLRFSFISFFDMRVRVLASMILGNPNGAGLSRSIVQRGSLLWVRIWRWTRFTWPKLGVFLVPKSVVSRFVDLPVDVDVKTTMSWGPEEEERAAPVSSEKPRDAADASSWGISERNPGCGCQVNVTRSPAQKLCSIHSSNCELLLQNWVVSPFPSIQNWNFRILEVDVWLDWGGCCTTTNLPASSCSSGVVSQDLGRF